MSKPIVTASYEQSREEEADIVGRITYSQPGIDIVLEFRLGDHERALALLDRAVADIRAQIEETR